MKNGETTQQATTIHGEIPKKFQAIIHTPIHYTLPYVHNQPEPPAEILIFQHNTTCTSIPKTLKLTVRPTRPKGVLAARTWNRTNRHFTNSKRVDSTFVLSSKNMESRESETNGFVVSLGSVAQATITTTGSGEGLVRDLDGTNLSHPFCRCTILLGGVLAQQTILRTVFAAKSFNVLLRSLIRIGFHLKPLNLNDITNNSQKVCNTYSLYDKYDINHCNLKALENLAPKMYEKAEADQNRRSNWNISIPLAGGRHLPIHSTTKRRTQTCYVTSFCFSKVTGHMNDSKFLTLEESRSVVLLYENRPMIRYLGCLFDEKEGFYKTLGKSMNTSKETRFQHKYISLVEYNNRSMSKILHYHKYWSPIFSLFVNKKNETIDVILQNLRKIGIQVKNAGLPLFNDLKYGKNKLKSSEVNA
jgi:hypothetical protein